MSTGDLKNNLRKLQNGLKKINYPSDVNYEDLARGMTKEYLPIYNYLFTSYSKPFAETVLNMNVEMSGKTDIRFVEAVFKVLRDLFSYKPLVDKEKFFKDGFGAERKVIMCSEIIQLIHDKHKSLSRKAGQPAVNSGAPRMNKSESVGDNLCLPLELAGPPRRHSAHGRHAQNDAARMPPPRSSPRVVNEMRSAGAGRPPLGKRKAVSQQPCEVVTLTTNGQPSEQMRMIDIVANQTREKDVRVEDNILLQATIRDLQTKFSCLTHEVTSLREQVGHMNARIDELEHHNATPRAVPQTMTSSTPDAGTAITAETGAQTSAKEQQQWNALNDMSQPSPILGVTSNDVIHTYAVNDTPVIETKHVSPEVKEQVMRIDEKIRETITMSEKRL